MVLNIPPQLSLTRAVCGSFTKDLNFIYFNMIPLNQEKAKNFLKQNEIENYQIKLVAGDASFRSYYRIFVESKTFILMFAPPSHENVAPFIEIDNFLVANNFSAPKIFAIDKNEGFILLEDFGDQSYSKALAGEEESGALELNLYKKSCDCLIELHKTQSPQGLALYNNELLFREVMLFVDWYLPFVKKIELNLKDRARFKLLWFRLFDLLNRENQVLVLRDFHADNLMVLQNKTGYKSVGLLDFQDAVIGCKAYDLLSLLEDARRDVNEKNRAEILNYYLTKSEVAQKSFLQDYAILSLQRNIKIIGIFARLATRDSKPHYLNLLPRVIKFIIMRLDSDDQIFGEMSDFLKKFI